MNSAQGIVFVDVLAERRRQDEKWGQQDHAPGLWALILGEEVGEAHKAMLTAMFGKKPKGVSQEQWFSERVAETRRELVQVAAVAVAWIEAIDREH